MVDKQSQMDLACIIWTLLEKNSPSSSVRYYLSIFNLNNWYIRCMPSKLKHLIEYDSDGKCIKRTDNIFFSNFSLPLSDDFDTIKVYIKLNSLFNLYLIFFPNSLCQ